MLLEKTSLLPELDTFIWTKGEMIFNTVNCRKKPNSTIDPDKDPGLTKHCPASAAASRLVCVVSGHRVTTIKFCKNSFLVFVKERMSG